MTVDIHLVRHGETVWHARNQYAGRSDVALTEKGLAQAEALGQWARTRPITRVVTSDLSRAVRTAAPAAAALGVRVEQDPRLREVDFGRGEGLTRAEMAERFPGALVSFVAAPATSPLPGGESGADAVARACPALAELAAGDGAAGETVGGAVGGAAGEVLLVAHNTLMRLLLCDVLGIDPDRYREVFPRLDNTAVTTLRTDGTRFALLRLNVPIGPPAHTLVDPSGVPPEEGPRP
jgi:probable phosphoglycerate mutase